jgi:hypothetical protein
MMDNRLKVEIAQRTLSDLGRGYHASRNPCDLYRPITKLTAFGDNECLPSAGGFYDLRRGRDSNLHPHRGTAAADTNFSQHSPKSVHPLLWAARNPPGLTQPQSLEVGVGRELQIASKEAVFHLFNIKV